ncbi:glycosyltransferase [Parabacteroides sp. PF5-9]|uniref:glycosyltransferase n=1 Tax=Parabacteroides sp. PF5-9 TaxID=1742404 RepID=UPI0024730F45|nr:glycosyltransferase [Parabacteroides sp. PF5-9]MDH6359069.1 hypothetical protein [Parabacteroides sp. PF5-9]
MTKKVLIICDLFPPAFGPRMGYLCKYLPQSGWESMVVTEKIDDHTFTFLSEEIGSNDYVYVDYYPAKTEKGKKRQWFYTFILDFLFGYKDRKMLKMVRQYVRNNKVDLVLCSTYRTFPLTVALKAAKERNLPLVVDLRDIIEQYPKNEFITHRLPHYWGLDKLITAIFKRKNLQIRNKVLIRADYVTTVSPWHVDALKPYNSNIDLIYNGYDPALFYAEQIKTKQFIITYTGRIYSTAMRDPSLFFEALKKMQQEGLITSDTCRVHWYVDETSWQFIEKEAEKTGVIAFMENKGYVPASQIPTILNHSSVLLLLTNKATDNGPKGILTTKFFESLAVEKPILCVRSDESLLADMLHETKGGLAARNVDEVVAFLLHYYREWQKNGFTKSLVDKEILRLYSRETQAGQFATLFDRLTEENRFKEVKETR